MPTVVGVRLRSAAKVLWFDPSGSEPAVGDRVIVRTERGQELGEIASAPQEVEIVDLPAELKPVERIATEEDLAHAERLREQEREAMPVFRELVKAHKLDMKPVDVELLFDESKLIFYFAAEERIDFRDLVKELASRFKTRIDMRQIGVRDEARLIGGIGHCGQQLCCARLGGEFQPVSIRMAKEQDLPLNPLKISGLCGRLMCCLRYEYDAYKDYKSRAPKRGTEIETPLGWGKVSEVNTPREEVTIKLQGGGAVTVALAKMECGKGCGCPCKVPADAIEAKGMPAVEPVGAVAKAVAKAEARGDTAEARAAAKAAEGASAKEGAAKEGANRPRRRRRPGKRDGGGEAAGAKAAAGEKPVKGQAPKGQTPKGGGQSPKGEGAQGGGDATKAAKPASRRRRRRRPGGGGGAPAGE